MRRSLFVLIVVAIMAMSFLAGIAQAQDKVATPAQANEWLKKAVAYAKESGCEKALVEFNNTKSPFNTKYKKAYVSAGDAKGITLAHGAYPFLAGQNHSDVKDSDGKPFVRMIQENLKKTGHSQVDFKWMDPTSKKTEIRHQISEAYNCGGSRGDIAFSVTYADK